MAFCPKTTVPFRLEMKGRFKVGKNLAGGAAIASWSARQINAPFDAKAYIASFANTAYGQRRTKSHAVAKEPDIGAIAEGIAKGAAVAQPIAAIVTEKH